MSEPAEPVFWFGFDVAWAKLVIARVVVFGLLAVDALLQLRHAPRYGAGGFNVGQLAAWSSLGLSRTSFAIGQLVNAYCFAFVTCGVAVRWLLPFATAIYGWLYFGSQLDSYQHHYLVWLVLVLTCFVPWARPPNAGSDTRVRSWAVRLILVQLGVMYAWAAISKLDPAWLDGTTLGRVIGGGLRGAIDSTVGMAWVARGVVVVELVLAATIWSRRTAWLAAILGIALHAGIVASGLEIGLFAWVMLALYVLVVPDRVWVAVSENVIVANVRRMATRIAHARRAGVTIVIAALVVTIATALACRLPDALVMTLVLSGFAGLAIVTVARDRTRRLALAHAVALASWLVVDRASGVAADYHRYWAGSARRLGDLATAERNYRAVIDLEPRDAGAHYHLGRVLIARGATDEGNAELGVAEQLEPRSSPSATGDDEELR